MKDKTKRDMDKIIALEKAYEFAMIDKYSKEEMCRKLIALAKKCGAQDSELFEIVKDDHFMRKQI